MNPAEPLVLLIPWDHIFESMIQTDGEHIVTVTESMYRALADPKREEGDEVFFQDYSVRISFLYDQCLAYNREKFEEMLERWVEDIDQTLDEGYQQWIFGNRAIIREFEAFYPNGEAQIIEPAFIIDPHTLYVRENLGLLNFQLTTKHDYSLFALQ